MIDLTSFFLGWLFGSLVSCGLVWIALLTAMRGEEEEEPRVRPSAQVIYLGRR